MTVNDLSLQLADKVLFEHVSFTLKRGDRLAIVGPNGSGKTSLLRAIMGEIAPLEGIIRRPAHLAFACAYQDPRWNDGLLREHLRLEGLDETQFRQILGVLGVEGEVFERDLATMSQGQRKKVDLARSFAEPGQLLIWDEPLNYLDVESRRQITEVILQDQPTLIFVEHDRHFVEAIATSSLNLGKATTFLKTDSPRKRVRRKANGPNPRSAPFLLMGKDRFIAALF